MAPRKMSEFLFLLKSSIDPVLCYEKLEPFLLSWGNHPSMHILGIPICMTPANMLPCVVQVETGLPNTLQNIVALCQFFLIAAFSSSSSKTKADE